MTATPKQQLGSFIDKFAPAIAKQARAAIKKMRARYPQAHALVYDNYNALAIGFGPSDRAGEAIFSIAVFPRWVSLFFLQGARLKDRKRLLKGSGSRARHIVLREIAMLDDPDVCSLMEQALERAKAPLDPTTRGKLIVKSISAKQRPRRTKI